MKGGDMEKSGKLSRFLDKMEAKSQRIEEKASSKMNKLLAKIESKMSRIQSKRRFRSKTKELVREAKKKPVVYALAATGGVLLTVPVVTLTAAAVASAFSMFALVWQMIWILLAPAGMFISAGAHFMQPAFISTVSGVATASTLVLAAILGVLRRTRSIPLMSLGTILPLISLWIAAIPFKSYAVVQSMRVLDPLRPLIADPFFRPLIPDVLFSDLLDILPNPFLIEGPVKVVVQSTTSSPFFAAKTAVSIMALMVAAWCWYREREKVALAFQGTSKMIGAPAETVEARPLTKQEEEDFEEDARLDTLKAWEQTYDITPQPLSKDPKVWSVDDLSAELEKAGLADCVEGFRKSRIDGKVALTLTSADEEEIRQELGINRLGQRRRLMLFLDDLRQMHQEHGAEGLKG